ncbi:hypothetical protein BGI35_00420 [Snodgrassella communis]|nr:hypothetical protein BGI35_00420 [Snodgrassella communis]
MSNRNFKVFRLVFIATSILNYLWWVTLRLSAVVRIQAMGVAAIAAMFIWSITGNCLFDSE